MLGSIDYDAYWNISSVATFRAKESPRRSYQDWRVAHWN